MEQRGQFTFYRSFWEAVQELPKKDRLPILEAIISYALDGVTPAGMTKGQNAFFSLVKPNLDSARKKAANGKQGGSKPKANGKQTTSKKENKKENKYEITKELYDAFNSFELEDLSYLNVWDRHMEQSEIWEPTLNERVVDVQESVEDIVMRNLQNEKVHRAIGMLPEVQKRRIKMYFFEGMTYEEIATEEECKHPAVVKSVKAALDKLKIILEE